MTYASPLMFSIHFPHAAYLEIEAEFTGIPSPDCSTFNN